MSDDLPDFISDSMMIPERLSDADMLPDGLALSDEQFQYAATTDFVSKVGALIESFGEAAKIFKVAAEAIQGMNDLVEQIQLEQIYNPDSIPPPTCPYCGPQPEYLLKCDGTMQRCKECGFTACHDLFGFSDHAGWCFQCSVCGSLDVDTSETFEKWARMGMPYMFGRNNRFSEALVLREMFDVQFNPSRLPR